MIQRLSFRSRRCIALVMYLVFFVPGVVPFYSFAGVGRDRVYFPVTPTVAARPAWTGPSMAGIAPAASNRTQRQPQHASFIGGPATPEASSFKAVGSDNLVNLFTGDFSYSIPLLDVDGYPVNLFYNGGITMEQDASWVGLGWNINPGSVSRNMRGVPDDFNGTDMLKQEQNVKPNKTWGGEVGIDGEVIGIKTPKLNFNLGVSVNNYLGPELELGAGISLSIPITQSEVHEKQAPLDSVQGLSLSFGADAKLSSRSGLTLSPSLNANLHSIGARMDLGVGLSTSYNSRTGIKDLNIHSQMRTYHSVRTQKEYTHHLSRGLTGQLAGTTISFARPSYIPTLRMPMQYTTTAGQIEFGAGMFGLRGAATAQGYYSESKVADMVINKPLVGYMYLEKANGRRDAVMDFNRVNDGEVTPRTPILSAPQYDYDIFSIQGEGTGGSIRAYRSDLGFMRDNETSSKDKNISIGMDIAPPGHFGGNWNDISTPTRSGNWDDANNTLNQTLQFKSASQTGSFENVYFRNPGEMTVTNDAMINKIGRDNLVRFQLGGSSVSPRLQSQLEMFSKKTNTAMGTISLAQANADNQKPREKRTQVITMLTAGDAAKAGLESDLKSYSNTLDANNNLQYTSFPRVDGNYRKAHHISEISVLESSGMRYVYGLPVYNITQRDFTFSVRHKENASTNLVDYDADEPTVSSSSIDGNDGIDGYCSIQTTPAYASSFMLTGLLSPDYVDRTGDGITEDDLGNAVKFDYTMSAATHKWRTPRPLKDVAGNKAHFNAGLRSERRDNKATISYGEREAWYLHAIESKSMIAIFSTSARSDAQGVTSELNGAVAATENANQKLDSIMLYTKSEIKTKGLAAAVPLKTVHFDYSYGLCSGTPDNTSGGKLTLTDIYFTFNGQSRASKNMYVFNYGSLEHPTDNPGYDYNASDRWGTYKPVKDSALAAVNPSGLTNIDYPYTSQNKAADDVFAGAWSLKKILLPSGGQMEVQYEADDYAYVQNRRACNMFKVYGLGYNTNYSQLGSLYPLSGGPDAYYAYVQLPSALQNTDPVKMKQELFAKYLDGIGGQLAFKLNVNMPKGVEPLTVYANYDDYGVCPNSADRSIIYLKLRPIDNKSPLANASVHFLIDNLPGQSFPGYDLSGESALQAILSMLGSVLGGLFNAFTNAEGQVRGAGKGSSIVLASSFVRLAAPTFFKYGGGHRVKRLLVKDNWNAMSKQYDAQYGQDYDYTTTTKVNGVVTTISSGVASYEPGIGSEENPFREIVQFENKLPLASAQYGAIEMPMLEGLYPSPMVGYSKVTVRSIHRKGKHADSVVRSAIGKQVTEFYTAKDYPSYSAYTPMSNMDYHHAPPFDFFYKETIDKRTSSQGFLVETNDMHGKVKSQASYSESDEKTPLSFSVHTYKNTGANGLNDLVDFVHHEQGGAVSSGNIGVDMELMTDVREFSVKSTGTNTQAQVEFYTFVPWPYFVPFVYSLDSYIENTYRAVTTTKLINYHAIEDSVIVNDKGSTVTTKTIAYDAETGSPLVNKTLNEFNNPVYTTNYPAYWAYSGMGPAYSNIDSRYTNVTILGGRITSGVPDLSVLESGDELYVESVSGTQPTCPDPSPDRSRLWVYDTTKNTTSLTVPAASRSLMVLDSAGMPYTRAGMNLRVIRSGHRNLLSQTVSSATCMANPIQDVGDGVSKLVLNNADNVVAASAVAFKEKWKVDPGVIPKTFLTLVNCVWTEYEDCNGGLQKHVNPYTKGLMGNYKPYRSYVYFGSRAETDPAVPTAIRKNGYLAGFSSLWSFDDNNNLLPDTTKAQWVWNTEITKVNAKGQEIETRDALNIYTAAQYGYGKELPVAITQNARSGESFEEGFEDYAYSNNISTLRLSNCDNYRYVSLNGITGSSLVNTDTMAFNAHTGKYILGVNANATASLSIPILGQPDNSPVPAFTFPKDTARVLDSLGGNYSFTPLIPASVAPAHQGTVTYSTPQTGVKVDIRTADSSYGAGSGSGMIHSFSFNGNFYINIDTAGTYTFAYAMRADYHLDNPPKYFSNELHISITDTLGHTVSSEIFTTGNDQVSGGYKVFLCPGIYHVSYLGAQYFDGYIVDVSGHSVYTWFIEYSNSPVYKNLSKTNGCFFTRAAPASTTMMNPVFNVPAYKKMQLSAWVREDCGTPCNMSSYTQNTVKLKFNDASNTEQLFKPAGPIIEGWQRYEAPFLVPATAATMSMTIINTSGSRIYFDDIRIHPFNANMKGYVYDPRTLRLSAELDENNYATFYDYDEEGQLVRVKQETAQGIKTIKETRSAKQKSIKTVQ
ncbi:MAG: hypothetical protein J0H74_28250 [Chitinophagaceae bacterium]|nr:hypothetical protein [Chitinophagaceae bacterium]